MNELNSAVRTLSQPKCKALALAVTGPLRSTPAGWLPVGRHFDGVSTNTVEALERDGLLTLERSDDAGIYEKRGTYRITNLGRRVVKLEGLRP